jgi:hypothetical protein
MIEQMMARQVAEQEDAQQKRRCQLSGGHTFGGEQTYGQAGGIIHASTCVKCGAVRKRGRKGADQFGRVECFNTIDGEHQVDSPQIVRLR